MSPATCTPRGRHAEAEPLYRKALEIDHAIGGDSWPEAADANLGLGVGLDALGRHRDAEPLLRKGLDIRRTANGEKSAGVGAAYMALAANLGAQGDRKQMERLHRRALDILRATLGEQHPQTALAYASVADDLEYQKRYAAAEPLCRKTLAILRATLGEHHPDTALAYDGLAHNLYLQHAPGQAESLSTRAVAIVREQRGANQRAIGSDPQTAIRRARADEDDTDASDDRIYARHLRLAWLAAQDQPGDMARLRDDAFATAQDLDVSPAAQALAQTAARAAGDGAAAVVARRRDALASHARLLESELVRSLPGDDPAEPARLRLALDNVGRELAAADQRLAQKNPRYDALISPAPLSPAQVQQRLQPGEGLLLIAPAGDDVYVFAMSATRVAWNRLAGGRLEMERRVHTLRCQVDDGNCGVTPAVAGPHDAAPLPPFDLQTAYGLYRDLVAPVEGALQGVDRLFVTTSGPLASLPLGMLVTAPPPADVSGMPQGMLVTAPPPSDAAAPPRRWPRPPGSPTATP